MMTPEDVLIEAISAASLHGDNPRLRRLFCTRLQVAIEATRKSTVINSHGITEIREV